MTKYKKRAKKTNTLFATIAILLVAVLLCAVLTDGFKNWNKYCLFGHDFKDGVCTRCEAEEPADTATDDATDTAALAQYNFALKSAKTLGASATSVSATADTDDGIMPYSALVTNIFKACFNYTDEISTKNQFTFELKTDFPTNYITEFENYGSGLWKYVIYVTVGNNRVYEVTKIFDIDNIDNAINKTFGEPVTIAISNLISTGKLSLGQTYKIWLDAYEATYNQESCLFVGASNDRYLYFWSDDYIAANNSLPVTHNVTFYVNDDVYSTIYVNDGEAITDLPTPVHQGYTFLGWTEGTISLNGTYDGWHITEDTNLYAEFRPNTYTIKFHGNGAISGGVGSEMDDQQMTYDQSCELNLNCFVNPNSTFLGWSRYTKGAAEFSNGQTVSNLTDVDGGIVDLYAIWEKSAYTVRFLVEGEGIKMVDVPANTSMNDAFYLPTPQEYPQQLVKYGYDFVGWYFENGRKYTGQAVTDDLVLTAKFEVTKYTVTLDVDGVQQQTTVEHGTVATLPEEPAKNGYVFAGWFLPDGTQYTNQQILEDTTLTAKFDKKHAVTFIVDGGTYMTLNVIGNAQLVMPEEPTKENFVFDGWYYSDGTVYTDQPITADTTLTARFEVKGRTVTCLVDDKVYATINVPTTTIAKLPADPTKEGLTFDGWYLADGTKYTDQPITEDTTFTAHFKTKQCTVSFVLDDKVYKSYICDYGTSFFKVYGELIDQNLYKLESEYNQDFLITDDIEIKIVSTEIGKIIPDEQIYTYIKYGVLALGGVLIIGVVVALANKGAKRK